MGTMVILSRGSTGVVKHKQGRQFPRREDPGETQGSKQLELS